MPTAGHELSERQNSIINHTVTQACTHPCVTFRPIPVTPLGATAKAPRNPHSSGIARASQNAPRRARLKRCQPLAPPSPKSPSAGLYAPPSVALHLDQNLLRLREGVSQHRRAPHSPVPPLCHFKEAGAGEGLQCSPPAAGPPSDVR